MAESLLLKKLSDGSPTSIGDILALLPEAKKLCSPLPAVPVKKGAQRVGTGHAPNLKLSRDSFPYSTSFLSSNLV
jgi:hypothetical protein